jgi:hypothetical protein
MITSTSSLIGRNDILVNDWVIFSLDDARHIFGYSMQTGLWQISSQIVEETADYIQTRSRKYFKGAPMSINSPLSTLSELVWLLEGGWNLTKEQVDQIMASIIPTIGDTK